MYIIKIRRATEDDYGDLSKNGKVLEFDTVDAATIWGRENIKSMWVVSWYVTTKF